MEVQKRKLVILGTGPAGYTAAVYAARAGLDPCLITGMEQGGQLTTTTDVENWPGDSDGLQGPELMERMKKHSQQFDVDIINDVSGLKFDKNSKLIWSYSLELNDIKPRVWSGFSYDRITNSLFIVTSNPGGLYGGNRKGKDLSVSLISIDALSGKKNWHFQHINHDLWDFDLVGNPIIFFSKINGINERVVAALSKTGDIFISTFESSN